MTEFIPETFGRYYLKKKKTVIDYLPPTEAYKNRREGTLQDILAGNQSNFTNEISLDKSLVTKRKLIKPTCVIIADKLTKFTVWDGLVISRYNGEQCKSVICLRPYQDVLFD